MISPRARLIIIMFLLLGVLIVILSVASNRVILVGFESLEQDNLRKDVDRAISAINTSLDHLSSTCADWSYWDDTYNFIQNPSQTYIDSNLSIYVLVELDVNDIIYVNPSGSLVYGKSVDLASQMDQPIPESLLAEIPAIHRLAEDLTPGEPLSGIILLPEGPALLAARQILTSNQEGPSQGTLIMLRILDQMHIDAFAQAIHLNLTLQRLDTATLPQDFTTALQTPAGTIPTQIMDPETIAGYAKFDDIYDQPAIMLRIEEPRSIYQQGLTSLRYFRLILLASGVASAGLLTIMVISLVQATRHESQELYRTIIEQTTDGILLVDMESQRPLESNVALQHMLGYSPSELRDLTLDKVVPQAGNDIGQMVKELRNKTGRTSETKYRRKDGTTLDVEVSMSLIPYGGRDMLCASVRDISERKRAEAAMRTSENRYRTLVEQLPTVIYINNLERPARTIYISPQIEQMLGFTPEEWMADPHLWRKHIHPEDLHFQPAEATRPLGGGMPVRREYRMIARDGSIVWVRDESILLRDEQGGQLFIQGVLVDISESVQAQTALRQSQERLRAVFTNAPIVMYALDSNGMFSLVEGKSLEVIGFTPSDLLGGSIFESFKKYPGFIADVKRALAGEEFRSLIEIENRFFESWYAPVRGAKGKVTGLIGVATDVTERTQRERELEAIASVSAVLRIAQSQEEVIHIFLEQITSLLKVDGASLALRDSATGDLVFEGGTAEWSDVIGLRIPAGEGVSARVIETGEPYLSQNVNADPGHIRPDYFHNLVAAAAVPLATSEQVIGVVWIGRRTHITQAEMHILNAISNTTASALQRISLNEQARQQAVELEQSRLAEKMNAVTNALNSSLKLNEVLDRLLEALAGLIPYDVAAVLLKRDSSLEIAAARGFTDPATACRLHLPLAPDDPFFSLVETGKPRLVTPPQPRAWMRQLSMSFQLRSGIIAPLIGRNREGIGQLCLFSYKDTTYTQAQAGFVSTFAGQALVALENARLFEESQRLAVTDELTRIFNRRHFFHLAEQEVLHARRLGSSVAAIMLDIDDFKKVNDTYSHHVGDQVLSGMGLRFQTLLRASDIYGRYGGEEFSILLPDTNLKDAAEVAKRLHQHIVGNPFKTDAGPIQITTSLGVAAVKPKSNWDAYSTLENLLNDADGALYAAKRAGKNQVKVKGEEEES
jgi:diguanylate cyclase (GGDEF)-like protein/PAS domain S-box-containing protein